MSARRSTVAALRPCSGAMYAGVPIAVPTLVTLGIEESEPWEPGRAAGGGTSVPTAGKSRPASPGPIISPEPQPR